MRVGRLLRCAGSVQHFLDVLQVALNGAVSWRRRDGSGLVLIGLALWKCVQGLQVIAREGVRGYFAAPFANLADLRCSSRAQRTEGFWAGIFCIAGYGM